MRLIDFFRPRVIATAKSKYSGQVRVVSAFGSCYLATGQLTQSGGLVRDVWQPVLKKLSSAYCPVPSHWLILGLAGGTVASMIAKKFPGAKITGVEIDPVMISLSKKYLNLDKIPNLEIIIKDAKSYILHLPLHLHFDYILVDMYLGDQLPKFVYDERFLKKLAQLGLPAQHRSVSRDRIDSKGERKDGVGQSVIFNHLFYDDPKRLKAAELVAKLKNIFPSVQLMRKLTNLLIICERKGYN